MIIVIIICLIVLCNKSHFNSGVSSFFNEPVICSVDSSSDRVFVENSIISSGLSLSSLVSHIGTYSIRGSVLDFFPFDSPFPVRVDFSFLDDIKILSIFELSINLPEFIIIC